jgi:hypothetical protein
MGFLRLVELPIRLGRIDLRLGSIGTSAAIGTAAPSSFLHTSNSKKSTEPLHAVPAVFARVRVS